ncbi:MAG TPA: response regulator [Aliidongia sp.]|uniref:response regulator n=1 Tax=Aliidongia sp. TaxID=1914230 RepID=UPI002DDD97DA|nr:response regulator [Aliidongia sp.]HEV2673738.1 response regulator [Aliidongia sp.]
MSADPATNAAVDGAERTLPRFIRGGRVLVVEDNPTNQIIVVIMLQKLGLIVDKAANGIEAVAAVIANLYDLVLMDMQMPEMDGLESTRHIRQLAGPHGQVPIIGVTANAFRQDHVRCLEAGMQAVVTKPFRWADLAAVMAAHLPIEDDGCSGEPRIADAAAWHRLIHDVGMDAARAITAVFLTDTASRLARIADHLAGGDVKAIGREAHALKSSVDLLGFEQMTRAVITLEALGRESADIPTVGEQIRGLTEAFRAVEAICDARLGP